MKGTALSGRLSVRPLSARPCLNTYLAGRDISVLVEEFQWQLVKRLFVTWVGISELLRSIQGSSGQRSRERVWWLQISFSPRRELIALPKSPSWLWGANCWHNVPMVISRCRRKSTSSFRRCIYSASSTAEFCMRQDTISFHICIRRFLAFLCTIWCQNFHYRAFATPKTPVGTIPSVYTIPEWLVVAPAGSCIQHCETAW